MWVDSNFGHKDHTQLSKGQGGLMMLPIDQRQMLRPTQAGTPPEPSQPVPPWRHLSLATLKVRQILRQERQVYTSLELQPVFELMVASRPSTTVGRQTKHLCTCPTPTWQELSKMIEQHGNKEVTLVNLDVSSWASQKIKGTWLFSPTNHFFLMDVVDFAFSSPSLIISNSKVTNKYMHPQNRMYDDRVKTPTADGWFLKYLLQKSGSLSARNTVKEEKYPMFIPMVWQIDAYPTLSFERRVRAHPSTAISYSQNA